MNKGELHIRINDRTKMLLLELSQKTGSSVSAIARIILEKEIESLLDESGNWKIDAQKENKGESE
jgi:predicted DNA-binding protein